MASQSSLEKIIILVADELSAAREFNDLVGLSITGYRLPGMGEESVGRFFRLSKKGSGVGVGTLIFAQSVDGIFNQMESFMFAISKVCWRVLIISWLDPDPDKLLLRVESYKPWLKDALKATVIFSPVEKKKEEGEPKEESEPLDVNYFLHARDEGKLTKFVMDFIDGKDPEAAKK